MHPRLVSGPHTYCAALNFLRNLLQSNIKPSIRFKAPHAAKLFENRLGKDIERPQSVDGRLFFVHMYKDYILLKEFRHMLFCVRGRYIGINI